MRFYKPYLHLQKLSAERYMLSVLILLRKKLVQTPEIPSTSSGFSLDKRDVESLNSGVLIKEFKISVTHQVPDQVFEVSATLFETAAELLLEVSVDEAEEASVLPDEIPVNLKGKVEGPIRVALVDKRESAQLALVEEHKTGQTVPHATTLSTRREESRVIGFGKASSQGAENNAEDEASRVHLLRGFGDAKSEGSENNAEDPAEKTRDFGDAKSEGSENNAEDPAEKTRGFGDAKSKGSENNAEDPAKRTRGMGNAQSQGSENNAEDPS